MASYPPPAAAVDPMEWRRWKEAGDAALKLGNVAAAVEFALRMAQADPGDPTTSAEMVRAAASLRCTGVFRNNERGHQTERQVGELFKSAHMASTPWEWDVRRRLWAEPRRLVGVALFPLASGGPDPGCMREFHVGPEAPRKYLPDCQAFNDAVERARGLATRALERHRIGLRRDIGRVPWGLFPDLPSNVHFGEGSVALAAFVAFLSFGLSREIDPRIAFTGVIDETSSDGFDRAQDIEIKVKALARERPFVEILFAPGADSGPQELTVMAKWKSVRAIQLQIFDGDDEGQSLFGLAEAPAGVSEAALGPSPAHQETAASVPAVLAAAGISLPLAVLHDALRTMGARVDGVHYAEILRDLERRGIVRAAGEVDPDLRFEVVRPLEAEVRLPAAHAALARIACSPNPPAELADQAAYHLAWAGQTESAIEEVTAIARRDGPAAAAAIAALLARIESGHQRHAVPSRKSRQTADRIAAALRASSDPTLHLASIAWSCRGLPWVFGSLGEGLPRDSDVDRLFWLQAVVESMLHLFAACRVAIAMRTESASLPSYATSLSERPSLGLLCQATADLLSLEGSEDGVRAFLAQLAGLDLPRKENELAERLTRPFNDHLHHIGAWQELIDARHDPSVATAVGAVAATVAAPLAQLVKALTYANRLEARGANGLFIDLGGGDRLDLQGIVVLDEPQRGPFFYRGEIHGQVRYWSLAAGSARYAPRPDAVAAGPLLWTPGALASVRPTSESPFALAAFDADRPPPRFPIADLPTPLARRCAHLRQAWGRPGLSALAAVDFALSTLLRLVWFAVFVERMPGSFHSWKDRPWLSRMVKRTLLKELADAVVAGAAGEPTASLAIARRLVGCQACEHLWGAVDLLERFEHATGELAHTTDPWRAAAALEPALEILASAAGELRFVARDHEGAGWLLRGVHPSRLDRAAEGLAPGEVGLQAAAGPTLPMTPFMLALPGSGEAAPRILLLAQTGNNRRDASYLVAGIGRMAALVRCLWERIPDGIGVRVV